MSIIFDIFTKSGRLLQDGYERLCAVDYDPDCEMVEVINKYDDLPKLESELEDLTTKKDKITTECEELEREVTSRLSELESVIHTAKIEELSQ